MSFLIVFVGAGIGGALRHGANQLAERAGWTGFPLSTLSLDTVTLWDGGKGVLAALYLVASVAVSIAALLTGLALARVWLRA